MKSQNLAWSFVISNIFYCEGVLRGDLILLLIFWLKINYFILIFSIPKFCHSWFSIHLFSGRHKCFLWFPIPTSFWIPLTPRRSLVNSSPSPPWNDGSFSASPFVIRSCNKTKQPMNYGSWPCLLDGSSPSSGMRSSTLTTTSKSYSKASKVTAKRSPRSRIVTIMPFKILVGFIGSGGNSWDRPWGNWFCYAPINLDYWVRKLSLYSWECVFAGMR